jgi:hypothetical protein
MSNHRVPPRVPRRVRVTLIALVATAAALSVLLGVGIAHAAAPTPKVGAVHATEVAAQATAEPAPPKPGPKKACHPNACHEGWECEVHASGVNIKKDAFYVSGYGWGRCLDEKDQRIEHYTVHSVLIACKKVWGPDQCNPWGLDGAEKMTRKKHQPQVGKNDLKTSCGHHNSQRYWYINTVLSIQQSSGPVVRLRDEGPHSAVKICGRQVQAARSAYALAS